MDRPHGLKAFFNELFGVLRAPMPQPAASRLEAQAPDTMADFGPSEPCIDAVRIPISQDAVVVGIDETAAGPLTGDKDFCVRGTVDGDIQTTGNILVTGLIKGGVAGANIWVQGGELCGDLAAREAILLDKDSLVVGNLSSGIIDVAGLIKGNILAADRAIIRGTAVLTGDIEAKSAIIEPGAAIGGKAHITGSDL